MARPPSVDQLARSLDHHDLPHPILVEIARKAIAEDRLDDVEGIARERKRAMLTPVVNATGVLLHTNLGRAPLEVDVASGYSNLELSLETGQRGSRQRAVGDLLASACGAEAAMVVNNCAGAVLLTFFGVGGERTDVVAHLTGFVAGAGMGLLYGYGGDRFEIGSEGQARLGVAAFALLVIGWFYALSDAA
ncbi:MAG: hypothetical protein AAGA65_19510, partial [Actinomycetota bacterium]